MKRARGNMPACAIGRRSIGRRAARKLLRVLASANNQVYAYAIIGYDDQDSAIRLRSFDSKLATYDYIRLFDPLSLFQIP
jgi:hypothetical protein